MAITSRANNATSVMDYLEVVLSNLRKLTGEQEKVITTPEGMLSEIECLSDRLWQEKQNALSDLAIAINDNVKLEITNSEMSNVIDEFLNIEYDEALEHATLDMMDSLCSTGLADSTDDGDLKFDSTVVATKADLKPVVRDAITRWVGLKLR